MARLPPDSFDTYVQFGPGRSYQAVADHYGVSKRAVTNRALKEGWQGRLADLERKARERSEDSLVDAIEEMTQRHLKTVKVIQRKALETLASLPLATAMHAVRALDLALRQERALLGDGHDAEAGSLEAIIRREHSRWMLRDGEDGHQPVEGDDGGT
ncbi:MAG: hypothetical protein H6697_12670 [Myxococcales bacterium]|nr:hypothetical protein [Myxococcales bacterium]